MAKRATPPITLPEYERLFRTIHAVVANEKGDPTKACLFFAVAGAYLLKRHHKLSSACPVARVAGYNLGTPSDFGIIFGNHRKHPGCVRYARKPLSSQVTLSTTDLYQVPRASVERPTLIVHGE